MDNLLVVQVTDDRSGKSVTLPGRKSWSIETVGSQRRLFLSFSAMFRTALPTLLLNLKSIGPCVRSS